MNICVLIGNGFDINLTLKTKYEDFYNNYYVNLESNLPFINIIKKDIKENITDWSDLELKLGEIASKFDSSEKGIKEYYAFYNDIADSLADYLENEEQKLPNSIIYSRSKNTILDRIVSIENYLNNQVDNALFGLPIIDKNVNINFVVFNYTNTLENTLNLYKDENRTFGENPTDQKRGNVSICHIHGFHDNRMVFGVDNKMQINNDFLSSNSLIATSLIKSNSNKHSPGLDIESEFIKIINQSNLIVIYGMSIGTTDLVRWKTIVKALTTKENLKVIIFMKGNKAILRRPYQPCPERDKVYERLFFGSTISDEDKENLKKRIAICFGSKIFDLI